MTAVLVAVVVAVAATTAILAAAATVVGTAAGSATQYSKLSHTSCEIKLCIHIITLL